MRNGEEYTPNRIPACPVQSAIELNPQFGNTEQADRRFDLEAYREEEITVEEQVDKYSYSAVLEEEHLAEGRPVGHRLIPKPEVHHGQILRRIA